MSTTGTLAQISRFPVKSFQGEHPERVGLSNLGIDGDRRLGLRDLETGHILSAKKAGIGDRLLEFSARTVPGDPNPDVEVDVGGETLRVATDRDAISERCSALLDHPVALVDASTDEETYDSWWPEIDGVDLVGDIPIPMAMATEKGTFVDLAGLHFVTSSSLRHLQRLAPDSAIDVQRFRPSFVIDLDDDVDGFVENDWEGRVRLGAAELELAGASPRCVMTTKAQGDLPRDLDVLKTLARENRLQLPLGSFACLGVYAEVATPGEIAVGDRFELI